MDSVPSTINPPKKEKRQAIDCKINTNHVFTILLWIIFHVEVTINSQNNNKEIKPRKSKQNI